MTVRIHQHLLCANTHGQAHVQVLPDAAPSEAESLDGLA